MDESARFILRDESDLPYLNPRRIQSIARIAAIALFVAALAVFLLVPLNTTRDLLGGAYEKLDKYWAFSVFALSFGAVFCWLVQRIAEAWITAPAVVPARTVSAPLPPRWLKTFRVVMSIVILSQVISQANAPFDLDENQRAAAAVTKSFWHEINPFRHTEVHAISHVFSILSLKVFGPSKIAFRLPSLLFTVAFLLVLFHFSGRYLSPLTSVLLYAHLAVNQMPIWFMHSMRGYISAMFITTVLLICLHELTSGRLESSRRSLVTFGVCFALSVFTHPFTGIFSLILLTSLVQWIYLRRDRLSAAQFRVGSQFVTYAAAALPIFLAVFVCVLLSLEPIDNVHAGGFEDHLSKLYLLLPSLFRAWAFRMLVVLLAVAALARWARFGPARPSFLTLFVANLFLFYGVVLTLLRVSHLEARWFIPFLVPILMWIGELVAGIPQPRVRTAVFASLFALLTVLPFSTRSGVLDSIGISYTTPYDRFLADLRERTAPVSANCYEFPDVNMGIWARDFYFIEAARDPRKCAQKYVVSLKILPMAPERRAEVILDHGDDYIAYRLLESTP